MGSYYQEIRAGKHKDQALQIAKQKYLQQADKLHAHPYYWAAFLQMGNTLPLYASSNWWQFLALGILVLLLFFILVKNGLQKRKPNQP